jgi:ABC-type multidrug transport system fused ATPase/permease subunit
MSVIPRYVLEVIAFGSIVAVTLVLTLRGQVHAVLPTLALYAFAGYRLMPAFQQFFSSAMSLRFSEASVASVEADLTALRQSNKVTRVTTTKAEPLAFEHEIKFCDVSFTYPTGRRPAISGISLAIQRNQSVGLVGRTGAGKTTLADLLLGLYAPSSGTILIDGRPLLEENERAWHKQVGYVPQHVFLANASVAENVALGVSTERIDRRAVEAAAQMAQADDFVRALPQGYDTVVGERGVKLSGGQRQRLGIARALYHNPDVLVFDEATSALDGMTEDAVMDAIRSLSAARTVVLIAHRLRTVQACDRILMLEGGEVMADGTYDELLVSSLPFRRLSGHHHDAIRGSGAA